MLQAQLKGRYRLSTQLWWCVLLHIWLKLQPRMSNQNMNDPYFINMQMPFIFLNLKKMKTA